MFNSAASAHPLNGAMEMSLVVKASRLQFTNLIPDRLNLESGQTSISGGKRTRKIHVESGRRSGNKLSLVHAGQ